MDRALGRVLTERPSDLARGLIGDMCKLELDCPCCPGNVMALWRRQLPDHVRAGIARKTLNKDDYEETLELADDIFASRAGAGTPMVAAVTSLDETQPAIPFPVPEVAAIRGRGRGGRARGRGGRGRGGGSAQATQQQSSQGGARQYRGPKHPDLPQGQWTGCQMHHRWGKSAFFCSEPSTCPWKDIFIPKSK